MIQNQHALWCDIVPTHSGTNHSDQQTLEQNSRRTQGTCILRYHARDIDERATKRYQSIYSNVEEWVVLRGGPFTGLGVKL